MKTQSAPLSSLLVSCFLVSAVCRADTAGYIPKRPVIDGIAASGEWGSGIWYPMDQHILGEAPTPEDFSARYTLRWDQRALYLLVELQDDILFDQTPAPLKRYWDDDCLEIFIDEDGSGGDHLNNYNAFAYHVALDNQVVDIGPGETPQTGRAVLLNEHVESAWQRSAAAPFNIVWEAAIKVYDDTFSEVKPAHPVALSAGKELGFMLAYCDNDGSPHREHFYGSHPIAPRNGDKNLGYIDASVFDRLTLLAPSAGD